MFFVVVIVGTTPYFVFNPHNFGNPVAGQIEHFGGPHSAPGPPVESHWFTVLPP